MSKTVKSDDVKKALTAKEAIDFLNDLVQNDSASMLYILPPEIESGFLSGEDDADEDGDGTVDDICVAQLKSTCELVMRDGKRYTSLDANNVCSDELTIEDEVTCNEALLAKVVENSASQILKITRTVSSTELPPSNKNTTFTWVPNASECLIPKFPVPTFRDCNNLRSHEQFEKFVDDKLLDYIVNESSKYAIFLGKPNPEITVAELRTFIGILLISGYNVLSSYRSFWYSESDMRNDMVYDSMRRNRFQLILQFLHFEDSGKTITDGDKMWKLRPLTDHLKANMLQHFHPEHHLSFDESMISYFGRHGCKQFIKGKPLRFGYKVWSLCTPSGYLVNFEIYQGKNPRSNPLYEERFGKCAAPLLNMIDDFSPDLQMMAFSFFFDNLSTSFPLLAYLKTRGYNATGTIRENRIQKSGPIEHKKS